LTGPLTGEGQNLKLRLSSEHQAFIFEKDPIRSTELLMEHSGGRGSTALMMTLERDQAERGEGEKAEDFPRTEKDDSSFDTAMEHHSDEEAEAGPVAEAAIAPSPPRVTKTNQKVEIQVETPQAREKQETLQTKEKKAESTPQAKETYKHENAPVDLLPPPKRKSPFSCFCL